MTDPLVSHLPLFSFLPLLTQHTKMAFLCHNCRLPLLFSISLPLLSLRPNYMVDRVIDTGESESTQQAAVRRTLLTLCSRPCSYLHLHTSDHLDFLQTLEPSLPTVFPWWTACCINRGSALRFTPGQSKCTSLGKLCSLHVVAIQMVKHENYDEPHLFLMLRVVIHLVLLPLKYCIYTLADDNTVLLTSLKD